MYYVEVFNVSSFNIWLQLVSALWCCIWMLSTISEFGHIEIYVFLAEGHWLIFLFLTTLIFYLTFFFYYFSLFYPVFFLKNLKNPTQTSSSLLRTLEKLLLANWQNEALFLCTWYPADEICKGNVWICQPTKSNLI